MAVDWTSVYERLKARIEALGVKVAAERMGFETTGVFDGISITTNIDYDLETCCHNIAHSLGHIIQWSINTRHFELLYETLYAAKAGKHADPAALEAALQRFREYEEEASEYAAWLLHETGNTDALPHFTNFARADIEAIIGYHRDGIAPIWHQFYGTWNDRVARGEVQLHPFTPRPIPAFTPLRITPQEVIQEVDGQA